MHIANIITRSLVVVLGVLLLLSVPPFSGLASPLQEVFGATVVLFGLLRLVLYFSGRRKQNMEHSS